MAGKTGLSVLSQIFAAENPLSVTGFFTGKNRNVKTNSKAFSKAIQPELVNCHVWEMLPGGTTSLSMRRAQGNRK
jgi:hypothetical protein